MDTPCIPENEIERLQALHNLNILDSRPEDRFDRLTRIARQYFDVAISLVSLVDADRQWFKSRQGLDATETGRDISFCGHAILDKDLFIVPDALEDARFADNPLVTGPPNIRFYAGAPLVTKDGYRIGTLCIIDSKPRELSDADRRILRDLADVVESELNRLSFEESAEFIKSSEANLKAVVDTVIDGIITINKQGIILRSNPATERLFGYAQQELQGQNVNMLMPEPYASAHDSYLNNYLNSGSKKIIGIGREVVGKRKDGSIFPMELAVNEMYLKGERFFVGVTRDISERKRIDQMKSQFVSTVSHELRTPLTSIRGALGLVLGGAIGDIPEKVKSMLQMANCNSERLTLLINDILDLEKIESGSMDFKFNSVDLANLVMQAVDANQGYAMEHQVQLKVTSSLSGIFVKADENRLLQVFANLISNAVKYSPKNDFVEVALTKCAGWVRVSVKDYGSGIPEEFRSRIFQRFAQADSSDTREKGGSGLGLSITKAIIEHHGGRIDFDSEPGKGATIYFELPEM